MDTFREIEGFKGYWASIDGKVYRRRFIKGRGGKEGYYKENYLKDRNVGGYRAFTLITTSGKKKTVYQQQIIASCYLKKPDHGTSSVIVVHIDGDKSNNNIQNLAWKTFSTFMKQQFTSGVRSNKGLWEKRRKIYGPMGGTKPPGRKVDLSNSQIKMMARLREQGYTLKRIAEKYSCSASHVYNLMERYKETTP